MKHTLRFDTPDERNRLDYMAQGVIGKPLPRPDGPAKVSGSAPYAAEHQVEGCLEGVLVTATIVHGKVTVVDRAAALGLPGVVDVISDERMIARPAQGGAGEAPMQHVERVDYWGQPIALVVAETFEQARHAAKHLPIEYEAEDPAGLITDPEDHRVDWKTEEDDAVRQGDLAHAMAQAPHTVDITFTTEGHASAAMELHASVAEWDPEAERLTVHSSLQMINYNIGELADTLGLEESQIRLRAPYVGGGFGSKLGIAPECVAASIAAMKLGRPVRVEMLRQQVFQCVVRRSETSQRVRLAADAEGRLIGFGHGSRVTNLPEEDYSEPVLQASKFLYAGAARLLEQKVGRIHRMTAGSVRAPGEAVGMQAIEVAMDELANETGMDPVELRLRNIPERHPSHDLPFSSRRLAECLRAGAEAFGWNGADRRPCQRREGEWWIGTGMASAARKHNLNKAEARVILNADGTAEVASDISDIGTGHYTIFGQIAGEMLGLDPADVLVRLGDSIFPRGSGSGGSWGAPSTGSAVFQACEAIRQEICARLGCEEGDLTLQDGFATAGNKRVALPELLDGTPIERIGRIEPGKVRKDYAQAMYGAFFCEAAVNAYTGETRLRRMIGAFGIGRVLNQMTARSQCLGGMVWGIGGALSEELVFDPRDGHLVNPDLAEYHVPVHADIPEMDAFFVEERDPSASPLQAKGAGELGIAGAAGAINNAIYNACGVRVTSFPMTPDKIMADLPMPA
jgi:xanthine dehydrogenase YagR molybdenum-binding subunit